MTSNAEKQLKSEAQEASQTAREKALETSQKFQDQTSDRILSITSVIRNASKNFGSQKENRIANGLNRLADYGDSIAKTLRDQSPQQLYRKVEQYSRRYPLAVFGTAMVIGFLVTRSAKMAAGQAKSETESELDLSHKTTHIRRVG